MTPPTHSVIRYSIQDSIRGDAWALKSLGEFEFLGYAMLYGHVCNTCFI